MTTTTLPKGGKLRRRQSAPPAALRALAVAISPLGEAQITQKAVGASGEVVVFIQPSPLCVVISPDGGRWAASVMDPNGVQGDQVIARGITKGAAATAAAAILAERTGNAVRALRPSAETKTTGGNLAALSA